jgi:hypothetical protein
MIINKPETIVSELAIACRSRIIILNNVFLRASAGEKISQNVFCAELLQSYKRGNRPGQVGYSLSRLRLYPKKSGEVSIGLFC